MFWRLGFRRKPWYAVDRWRLALASAGALAAMVLGAALVAQAGSGPAAASTLPAGFRDSVVLSGLTNPTVLQFAPDGRIFVGQKNGVIKVFQSLTDTNPVTFADLSGEVDDYWDRGLLGLALPPNFPASPYVYVLYAYDAPIAGTAPVWNDGCPTPPGPTTDGCARLGACVTAADQRERHDRQRAGADQRLVPAVPEPLGRHAPVRARRVPLRQRG